MHRSVFLTEAVESLNVKPDGKYIDATVGEGGHTQEILKKGGSVLGIDADQNQSSKHSDKPFKVVQGNFAQINEIAAKEGFFPVDGILFDFGLSMEQLTNSKKGLSYREYDEHLDMRIGDTELTAADFIQKTEPDELQQTLMKYSEDVNAEAIAQQIVKQGTNHPVTTVRDLVEIIDLVLESKGIYGEEDKKKVYARIFQALRIVVNDEFGSIQKALEGSLKLLKKEGKIVIITFHSLEDRIVKLFAREHAGELDHQRIKVDRKRRLQSFERSATLRVLTKL